MKVLHVSCADIGGAGIAAARLSQALISRNVDSSLLVCRKQGGASFVHEIPAMQKFFSRIRAAVANRVLSGLGFLEGGFKSVNCFPSGLHKKLNASDADMIHLHWVNAEMISVAELAKITKPVVWTLHDMWPFCGAEHYTTSARYISGYRSSEFGVQSSEDVDQRADVRVQSSENEVRSNLQPATSNRRTKVDLDHWVFRRKQKHWKDWRPHIVTCSNWLGDCARQSMLLKDLPIDVIPNCLDLN